MPEDELDKEPSFFSTYGEWLSNERYIDIFEKACEQHLFVGEASTAYLTDPTSAPRIYRYDPSSRIVIILRNPADRACSLYAWMVQEGYEYASSFEEALSLEDIRSAQPVPNWFEPQYYWNYMYFRSGLYYEQVKRYIELFGDNVLVLNFDQLKSRPQELLASIFAFLGIEPIHVVVGRHNASGSVVSPKVQFALRKLIGWLSETKMVGDSSWREVRRAIVRNYRETMNMLSTHTRVSIFDAVAGEVILLRILSYLRRSRYLTTFESEITKKQDRDRLLAFGRAARRPAGLSPLVRSALLERYASDVGRLSELTGQEFTYWINGR